MMVSEDKPHAIPVTERTGAKALGLVHQLLKARRPV
jgi:hypothetical protein